jgi:DNA-binding SARP family transcriptional activator
VQFRILGPLEVWDDGVALPLGGPRTRALLALLLLHANEVVSSDRLIDELWGENSSDGGTALRVNVSRLRKALAADVLVTRTPGYAIRVEPDQLDLSRFERLVDEARELRSGGELAGASERLRQALGLWRGPALADLAYASFAQGAIARLEEIRLAALELRIEADLALGRARELVAELQASVAEHPLRERLVAYLMLALYRTDRQAEALEVFRQARRTLVDELGIEPGASLQGLERAILQQDPALLAAPPPGALGDGERSILVAIADEARMDALLAIAEPLARHPPRVLVLARLVRDATELAPTTAWLAEQASALRARRLAVRTASFTTTGAGAELARLASDLAVDLLLATAPDELLHDGVPDPQLGALLAGTPCDVALLVPRETTPTGGVLVPFGGADHDWAAVELGAWFARAQGLPLRLAGAEAAPQEGRRDASRLLSHGALAVQRVLGVDSEPLLVAAGAEGLLDASREAGLLVVGLSPRWHRQGLGEVRLRLARDAPPPTVFVRRGRRPGGLAPPEALTRFTWSIRA